jgi:hypothetical protein
MMFEIPAIEAWDIDEELDFTVADILYRYLYEDANQSMGEDRQPGDEQ